MTEKEITIDTVLTLIKSGLTLRESLTRLGLDDKYGTVKNWMLQDKRYVELRKQQKEKILLLYDAGYSNSKIADELHVARSSVGTVVSRSKPSGLSNFERIAVSAITLSDVALFKEVVSEGEKLCCDITEYGTKEICVVIKKYPHFAMTDKGGIPWSWLTVRNRERIGK